MRAPEPSRHPEPARLDADGARATSDMTDTSSPSPSPRRGRAGRTTAALVAAMAVIVLGFIARQWQSAPEPTGIVEERAGALVFAQPRTLDMVALSDHHSEPFTAEDLHGRWTVLFFGFTSCPDVCPTTLNELDRTSQLLADHPIAERLRFVMITVDPARDTAARMAEYLGKINPGLVGGDGRLSGSAAVRQAVQRVVHQEDRRGRLDAVHRAAQRARVGLGPARPLPRVLQATSQRRGAGPGTAVAGQRCRRGTPRPPARQAAHPQRTRPDKVPPPRNTGTWPIACPGHGEA